MGRRGGCEGLMIGYSTRRANRATGASRS